MLEMKILACVFLFLFLNLATLDGIYLHLYKYKLYARKDSKKEHLIHSVNSFFFPWSVYLIFLDQFQGVYLWLGVLINAISFVIEYIDIFEEKRSRASLGGLASYEYAMHMAMSALRACYTVLIFVSRPSSDWNFVYVSPDHEANVPYMEYFIYPVVLVGFGICALHFSLIVYQKYKTKH